MSSKFYDELAALDRGIANRWKARSRDNPKYELKLKDMVAILEPLLFNNPSKKITDNQIKAIAKLVGSRSSGPWRQVWPHRLTFSLP